MKMKFLLGFVFMLFAFAMQAQYVGPTQAIQILNTEATNLENGSTSISDFANAANLPTAANTVTGLSNNGDISLASMADFIYPTIMFQTAKEIELAGNSATGVLNAETFFAGTTNETSRKEVIDAAFAYIKDLISI